MKKIANTFLMSRFLVGGPGATGSDEESGQAREDRLDRRSAPRKAHKNTIFAKPKPKQAKKTRKQKVDNKQHGRRSTQSLLGHHVDGPVGQEIDVTDPAATTEGVSL